MISYITRNAELFFTFTTATIGQLGSRLVKWIGHALGITQSINTLATNRLFPTQPELDKRIKQGYGEFTVFYPDGKKVEKCVFEKVWPHLAERPFSGDLQEKIKEIDSELEVCFIPRTLYELVFVRKCIQEDKRNAGICELVNSDLQERCHYTRINGKEAPYPLSEKDRKNIEEMKKERRCWHVSYFQDRGDPHLSEIVDVAYRLNSSIAKHFPLHKDGMAFKDIKALTEAKIDYLEQFYKQQQDLKTSVDNLVNCSNPGPTTCFGIESTRCNIKPMGIQNKKTADILRNAVVYESSVSKAFLLFRGANFSNDEPTCKQSPEDAYSLSYGTGLFAGCIFDPGACAFGFMRNAQDAYVLTVPEDKVKSSPFHIPLVPAVCQFFGHREMFHARSLVWKGGRIGGGIHDPFFFMNKKHKIESLYSDIPKSAFLTAFQSYMKQTVFLK